MGAGIQLQIDPFNFDRVRDAMVALELRVKTAKPVLEVAGKYLVTRAHESFERQATPEGIPWAPLSPVTIAKRDAAGSRSRQRGRARRREAERRSGASLFSGDRALFVTGRLFGSITFKAGEQELAVGTNAKFPGGEKSRAAIHQMGGKAGRGHKVTIPARPFLGITTEDAERIATEFEAYLTRV